MDKSQVVEYPLFTMMSNSSATSDQIRKRFQNLRVWQRGDQRAPHKPLLLLLALARCLREDSPQMRFAEIEEPLARLLKDFGPARKSYHPEFPFWHLCSEGIWEMPQRDQVVARKGNNNPTAAELRTKEICAGFSPDIFQALKNNPQLVLTIAHDLLDEHFPASIHGDILAAAGLEETEDEFVNRRAKKRDPEFRRRIMLIYNYQCAICGLDIRIENSPISVEAAHIKWHQANGPSSEDNGIALCPLHHKLFDRGAIALDTNLCLLVSDRVHGSNGFDEWVRRFDGLAIRRPANDLYTPRNEFVRWHVKEVFQGMLLNC